MGVKTLGYAIAALSLACPAMAQDTPLSAAEFEALTTGKTLSYARDGNTPYGAERYLPGRRVIWAFTGEDCKSGRWYEDKGAICFVYEDTATPNCWKFYADADGLTAEFADSAEGSRVYALTPQSDPLHCPGPKVGV